MRAGRTRPRAASRRCLALVFPWLPSERLRSTRPHLFVGREETPVVFVTGKGQAARLVAVDRLATQEGLAPGLTLADARARVAAAESYEQDDHADHAWLEGLSEACGRYAASIALSPPDALILDVDSDVHGFRDDRSLADDVEERFARRGVVVRHAFGDTPAIAEALARFSGGAAPDERGAVRRLPLAALGLDEEDAAALREAGLRHVGEVMAQPHAMLATRFGKAVATAVRRLAANEEPSLATPRRNAPLAVERRFPEPIARGDAALEAIGALVLEAGAVLAARGQKGRR